jgi:glutaredoxin 2
MFLEIYTQNPKLKEIVLKKLLKNTFEIVKRIDDSIKFLSAEIKISENKIFGEMLNKDALFFAKLFKLQINVFLIYLSLK